MTSFSAWDIVKVPFPYTDRPVRQKRPALVLTAGSLFEQTGLLWVLMITSAENRAWPGDVEIIDLATAGLPAPSIVRTAKIACIDGRDAERLGMAIGDEFRTAVVVAVMGRFSEFAARWNDRST